jgi:threonylcarbamoyladenosine tRNA methylthiotransferase MtaB
VSGPELITLGCRLNIAESDAMRALAHDQHDLIIVNSCAVTAEAVRQTRKAIRRARLSRPDARILVTGCAAEIEPDTFARMPEVTGVVSQAAKHDPSTFFHPRESGDPVPPPNWIPAFAGMTTTSHHTRAFVEVQNGCDHACTFCIIPQGRGPSRSIPAGLVIDRIKALVDQGVNEIVLTGVDVTSYGPDLPGATTLGQLVERILRYVPALPRLRLSSLDSVEVDDRLFDLATSEPRLMPHLHLSLQAGDDLILKRMKRRHSRAQAIAMVARLKAARPEIAIGADIIAGFPTETEEMFQNSLRLLDECDIVHAHIFPFSPRAGTPAARMPQVDPAVAKARAARLREASEKRQKAWLESQIGTVQNVLIERDGHSGHSENFARVHRHPGESRDPWTRLTPDLPPAASMGPGFRRDDGAGQIIPTRITALTGTTLSGLPA